MFIDVSIYRRVLVLFTILLTLKGHVAVLIEIFPQQFEFLVSGFVIGFTHKNVAIICIGPMWSC